MLAFNIGVAISGCAIGLFVALGFVSWLLKIKLAKQIKLVIYVSSVIISSLALQLFADIQGSQVVIPITISICITILLSKLVSKKQIDKNGLPKDDDTAT
jgi:hypothetical protein